nr:integrase, catalytic region, zinc finger, CCHC-type, peptidase aspartic, catalytic [Tanacetum cinerariifolium]
SANKKQEFVKTDNKKVENKDDEKKRDMIKFKCYNYKKEGHFVKDCKKVKVKDYEYYKTKMLLAKKDKDEQVLLAEDQAWMESSSDSDQEINANMVFMAQIEKVLSDSEASSSSADEKISEVSYYLSESKSESEFETSEYYDNSTNYGLFVNNDDDQEIFHDSEVDHNDSKEKEHLVDKLIKKFNHKIAKCQKCVEKANQQTKDFENQNKDLQDKYDVLKNQTTTFEINNNELNEQLKVLIEKNDDLLAQMKVLKDQLQVKHVVIDTHVECHEKYAKLEAERYDYMIRYSALFDNDKQHRNQIADQEVLFDKMNFEKIDSLFRHTSSLKLYVPNVILEKIIINLEDEVVSLLEKDKANSKTIESLKSKGFESSENVISESENQSENDCLVVEKECDKVENSKVIAPGMFKLSVSQTVTPISMTKTSCDSINVENCLDLYLDHQFRMLKAYDGTPQQNGVVESKNRTLVEAARTMLTFANLPSFLWAEAIATAYFTQNRLIIHKCFDKTPYELINKRKPNIKFFCVFGCRCYLLNDYEDVGKLKAKGDIRVFVGYSKDLESCLSNLNETGKSSNPSVSQVSEASRKVLEDLFHNFYDEYFDSSKIMKSSTTNVETSINEEAFHEISESFQGESSSSSLNDDVQ